MTTTETSSTRLSQVVATVAHLERVSPVEAQALKWIREHPPYICDSTDLHNALKVNLKYGNKLLERLQHKGWLLRTSTGRYELAQKPLAAFLPPGAVAVGGIVHRAVVEELGGPRINGLQMNVHLGEVGSELYRRIGQKV